MVAGGHYDRGDNQNEVAAEKKEPGPAKPAASGGFSSFFKRTAPSEDSKDVNERVSALSEKMTKIDQRLDLLEKKFNATGAR